MPRTWTEEQFTFMRENFERLSWEDIAERLGKTTIAVKSKARIIGIRKRIPVSADEIEQIKKMYPFYPTDEVAKRIGRAVRTINNAAHRLGIKKDPEYLAAKLRECGRYLRDSGKLYRFPKGHVPMNKGLRRPGWSAGRMKETQFKKGSKPQTWKPGTGHERVTVDGYVEIKVTDEHHHKNYRLKHRVVWEDQNGPIPKGSVVVFRDGNEQNCDISNLELITRVELMARNTVHNYPEPVKSMMRQMAGFRRKLNSYAKKQNTGSAEHAVRDDGKAA